MRGRYEEVRALGAEVVAIGTGDSRYARDFIEQDEIPYPVLVDDDARAANAAAVERMSMLRMFDPSSYSGTARAWRAGHRLHSPGKRVDQLGASFVVGRGGGLRYAHWDAHAADHAPIDEILGALRDEAPAAAGG